MAFRHLDLRAPGCSLRELPVETSEEAVAETDPLLVS
jgi:hypothetical protein